MDGSILVQTCSSLEETLEFLEIAAQGPFVLGVVGWVDLTDLKSAGDFRHSDRMVSPSGSCAAMVRNA